MNKGLTCPSCGKNRIKRKAKVCPKCGYLIYEYFNYIEYFQPSNPSNVQPPYLAPTSCLIKKLNNADKKKTKLRFFKYSFVSIDYGMLLILGKNKVDKPESFAEWYDDGRESDGSYDELRSELDYFLAYLIGRITGFLLSLLFYSPKGYYLVIGLRPEHVSNITYKEVNNGKRMIVELYDGNLIEITSNQECYNKIDAWWQNRY